MNLLSLINLWLDIICQVTMKCVTVPKSKFFSPTKHTLWRWRTATDEQAGRSVTQLNLPTIQNHLFSWGNASHVRLVAVRCGPSMCCICVFSWYLKFCSEPSCSPLKPLILTTMSWHACPSSGKIVNSACSYNLNTKSGWPGPLLFFLHPFSVRHSFCEHQRQAGRQGIDARTLGWPHGPATWACSPFAPH